MASEHEQVQLSVTCNYISGLPVPPFMTQERLNELESKLVLRPTDLIVNTYPKSGTTWLQQIVKLLHNNGKEDGRKIVEAVPWAEGLSREYNRWPSGMPDVDGLPDPRSFKSHMPYERSPGGLPHTTPAKYIYVIRNGKDVAVSAYHQNRGIGLFGFMGTWDDFFPLFMEGKLHFGSWFDHVLGWWKHRDAKNILFLTFEDLKKDLSGGVRRIVEFMELELSPEVIEEVARQCCFENMKDNPTTNYSWADKRRHPGQPDFMRKGVVGDWKNYFTPEQNALFDKVYADQMHDSGLELNFEV